MDKLWTWRKFLYSLVGLYFVFLACSFVGALIIGVIVGILLLLEFNVYVAAGIIIGIIALCMTIDIMKEY